MCTCIGVNRDKPPTCSVKSAVLRTNRPHNIAPLCWQSVCTTCQEMIYRGELAYSFAVPFLLLGFSALHSIGQEMCVRDVSIPEFYLIVHSASRRLHFYRLAMTEKNCGCSSFAGVRTSARIPPPRAPLSISLHEIFMKSVLFTSELLI